MPKQTAKTGGLAAKYADKGRKAVASHREDETKYQAGMGLPAGIEDGLAQLTKCYFGVYEKGDGLVGEYYFRAEGTIIEPKSHNGVKVEGRMTSLMEPMCDTPTRSRKTIDDHVAWVLNEMRKLGLDTRNLQFDDLETAAAQLQEAAPLFSFRTWAGAKDEIVQKDGKWFVFNNGKQKAGPYSNETALKGANPYAGQEPRVNEVWNGVASDQTPPAANAASDSVQDDTAPADESTGGELPDDLDALGELADGGSTDAQTKITELARGAGLNDEVVENAENWTAAAESVKAAVAKAAGGGKGGDDDLAALGEAADSGDAAAQKKLTALAKAKDIDPDSIETWAEVATMLADGDGESDWTPTKGQMYLYKPKGAKKAVEYEVTAVFDAKQTANLRNVTTGESLKGIPWADFDPNK